jgi:hypothetical protein
MDVRICGPNLWDQTKGTFHVHADGCRDLARYGPNKSMGGDVPGEQEMLVKDATMIDVVESVYANQLDETATEEDSRETIREEWVSDFYFHACCQDLPYEQVEAEVDELVYEAWIGNDKDSFIKFSDLPSLQFWLVSKIQDLTVGNHLHVGVHSSSEYSNDSDHVQDSADGTMTEQHPLRAMDE